MNKNINLCELLKGHEGETFYSPIFGNMKFTGICSEEPKVLFNNCRFFYSNGKYYQEGDCVLFPSKEQRDWNKWAEQQNPKVPKTLNELIKSNRGIYSAIQLIKNIEDDFHYLKYYAHESAVALLKIHQLIEVSYGGNITNEEWKTNNYKPCIFIKEGKIQTGEFMSQKHHIAFHTIKQRDEFLSYPENVQLVKDFYMI